MEDTALIQTGGYIGGSTMKSMILAAMILVSGYCVVEEKAPVYEQRWEVLCDNGSVDYISPRRASLEVEKEMCSDEVDL